MSSNTTEAAYPRRQSSLLARMTSTIDFPVTHTPQASKSTMSLVSARHATALEVCDVLYGPAPDPIGLDAIERYYESGASEAHYHCRLIAQLTALF